MRGGIMKRRGLVLGTVFMFSLLTLATAGCTVDGKALFEKEGCNKCHRFKGVGGSICPDLTDVKSRRSREWIHQQLTDPSVNNPDSKMPSFGHLSEKEKQALIDYLYQ
jgi:cbb3-type cytochrome oxidase cytochrome c subunit